VLLSLAKQLDGGKGSLNLCGLNASVKQVFDVAGFSKLFSILPDRAAVLKALPSSATQSFKAAQALAVKQEPTLGQRVAQLIGASMKLPTPHPQAAELALAAAELLGAKPVATKPRAAPAAAKQAAPPRAAAPASMPPAAKAPEEPKQGVLGKLRGLFGGKR
jgi:hypothetical protein